ncbi:MAG: carboxypeptidase regulatory-like domain-containing protein [Longimicrobiales bacterium]
MRLLFTCCLLVPALALLSLPSRAQAQNILVQVTEAESGNPISGAFLSLLRADGSLVRHALSNPEGRFLFVPGNTGPFTVKAEMIGRETRQLSNFTLNPGESRTVSLGLPVRAITLAGIEVQAEERCRLRPEEATTTAQVWEEARKALVVQQWAESEQVLEFGLLSYSRDLDPRRLQVLSEERRGTRAVSRNPIQSLSPEALARDGFVQAVEGGQYDYFGPDARVLLSDMFLDTHCMNVTRSRDFPGSVGLAFQPVDRGGVPDIVGTLWLSAEDWRLQFLEYAYTWSPYDETGGTATGRVEFESLPSGAWIIRRWWIRMPMVARNHGVQRWGGNGLEVIGYREVGGEISDVSTLDNVRLVESSWATLTGTVWDSTAAGPLAGAEVFLEGTGYATTSDSAGHFYLSGLPQGRFIADFRHPRLDTLNVLLQGGTVDLVPGGRTEVFMTIPSFEALATSLCQEEEIESGGGTLVGEVKSAGDEDPIPAARIQVAWRPPPGAAAGDLLQNRADVFPLGDRIAMETATNPAGWYTACGVPSGVELEVVAEFLEGGADTLYAQLAAGDSRRMDFQLGLPPSLLATVTTADAVTSGSGTQGIQGRILDRATNEPLRTAEVALRAGDGRILASGTTNDRGFFRLLTRLPGSYSLTVEAMGYERGNVDGLDVKTGRLNVVEMSLPPQAFALEPLVVVAEPRT